jgi:CRISPR-associated endonuclease/helicase Cas3
LWDNANITRESARKKAREKRFVDFGILALGSKLPEGEELAVLCSPTTHAAVLLPAHLDLLVQTSPVPNPSPDVAVFLHGFATGPAAVTVVWRADLPDDDPLAWSDRVGVQPPVSGEGCSVPFSEVRRWLGESPVVESSGDLEGHDVSVDNGELSQTGRKVLRWRGADDNQVIEPGKVRPGDTIVVPAAYGGCDAFGWNPASDMQVRDVGDAVAQSAGRRPVLRLAPEMFSGWFEGVSEPVVLTRLREWATEAEEAADVDPREALAALAQNTSLSESLGWLRDLALRLRSVKDLRLVVAANSPSLVGRDHTGREVSTANDGSALTLEVPLCDHSDGVQTWVERFVESIGFPDETLGKDFSLAAQFHDVGKADPRFQIWLHAGDEIAAARASHLLAKSAANARNRSAMALARARARYPENCRHEVMSLALIQTSEVIHSQATDWDLVLHLVASHHGFCRPLAPVVYEDQPVEIELAHRGIALAGNSVHELHHPARGVPDRFWQLIRKYGWWGLAWLEACLRLADHRRSEQEESIGGNNDD